MRFRRPAQFVLLIPLVAVVARVLPGPRTVDDAYITFRYAQNLLSGYGLVYNPGEAVLGTTTPVYALLMAGLGLLAGGSQAPFPELAWLANALIDGVTCWLLILLGRRLGHRTAGIAAAAIWAVAPMSVTFAIGGMETSLFIALSTATFYFHSKDRPLAAAACGGLSLVTRPDAVLFLLPLGLERLRRSLRDVKLNPNPSPISAREGLLFALPALVWAMYGGLVYGNPIPHSILAKVAAYRLPPESGLVRMLQHYATPFLGHRTFGTGWIGVGLILFPFLFAMGALKTVRRQPGSWPILAYPWVYMAAFSLANPLIFRWYLAPPLPIFFLGIFLGAERIGSDLGSRIPPLALAVAALALTINGWTLRPDHGPERPAPDMAFIQLELLYRDVGERLRGQIAPDQVLAAGDIGALGYYSGARILDTVGLISPQATAYYPLPEAYYVINYAVPPDLISDLRPDYLVILEAYGRYGLLHDPEFLRGYERLELIPTDLYGSRGMLVFRRLNRADGLGLHAPESAAGN